MLGRLAHSGSCRYTRTCRAAMLRGPKSSSLALTSLDSEENVDSQDMVRALQMVSPTSRVLVRTSQGSALPLLTLTAHWSVSPSCLLSPVWARLCSPAAAGSQLQAQAEK